MRCKIDIDKWENVGKIYFVHEAKTRENSTAMQLTLEDDDGNIITTTAASHQIEWLD